MRGLPTLAATTLALCSAPALAQPDSQESVAPTNRESDTPAKALTDAQAQVMMAADAFLTALSSEDRTQLPKLMMPEGMIFVHDRFGSEQSQMRIFSVEDFLFTHANRPGDALEVMHYETILVDGDMAQVWGPYSFSLVGKVTHCGINSLSMVKQDGTWKVGNTSFTMVSPQQCEAVGVSWLDDL